MIKKNILFIFILLLLVVFLFPLWWMFSISLKGENTILQNLKDLVPIPFTLKNYSDVWTSGPFPRYLFNSFFVTTIVVLGNLLFCSMAGFAYARYKFIGKNISFWLILGTLMVPKQVLMIPIFMMMKNTGLYDTYWALILPFLVDSFGIFLMCQYIKSLPVELEDAARIDGAGEGMVFFRIVMPLAKPALIVVAIRAIIYTWNNFLYPLIVTQSQEIATLPVGLAWYAQGEHSVNYGHLMAGSAISTLPLLIVFFFLQKQIIEGMTEGAIKG
jgi:multiple sugar transport system permease protein